MGIQAIDSTNKYSQLFSMKYALTYLPGVFLLPVWLFSRSVAILSDFLYPEFPLEEIA